MNTQLDTGLSGLELGSLHCRLQGQRRLKVQIINTAIQVTSKPVLVAVIINKKNLTHE
jgi:hypothetical protein